jgi:hypothetical protein
MKIKILFIIDKAKCNKLGLAPLRCRITYLGERKPFATGLFINSKNWDSGKQTAKPPNLDNDFINTQLSLIKNKINQAFLYLQVKDESFDVDDIYRQYKGETTAKEYGLIEYYEMYLDRLKKLVGVEIKQQTWNKFSYIRDDVEEFIKYFYHKPDIKLKDLDFNFIIEFEYYLKTVNNHQQITVKPEFQISEKTGQKLLNWCNNGKQEILSKTIKLSEQQVYEQIQMCNSIAELAALYKQNPQHQENLKPDFEAKKSLLNQLTHSQNFNQNGLAKYH